MSMIKKTATAAAIAALCLGIGAGNASAYAISGISGDPFNYTGVVPTGGSDHTRTVGGFYTITCPAALTTFSGTATGADNTSFTPSYGGTDDCEFLGLPASVTQSGTWNIKVTGGSGGVYSGEIHIPATSTTVLEIPLAACTRTITGPQTFKDGVGGNVVQARNVAGGVEIEVLVTGIVYTTSSGCPYLSSNDGEYNTNGPVSIPGIEIS